MKLICLYCEAEEQLQKTGKIQRCGKCGGAMAPHEKLLKIVDGLPGLEFNESVYKHYSRCPNAQYCYSYDLYKPSCEDLVFTPACLHWLFAKLDRSATTLARAGKIFHAPHPPELSDPHSREELDK